MIEKPAFASLSAGLLARKGTAKPAMRPQLFKFVENDDLGWNDMGTDMLTPEQMAIVSPNPPAADMTEISPAVVVGDAQNFVQSEPPHVILQRQELQQAFPPAQPVPSIAPRSRAAAGAKPKSAFTLRLDQERHLKLRLASAYTHRSAQQLLVEALDKYLAEYLPHVDDATALRAAS